MQEHIPLTLLPKFLSDNGFDAPNYRTIYEAARSADIPAIRKKTGRWYFSTADIDQIVERLELDQTLTSA